MALSEKQCAESNGTDCSEWLDIDYSLPFDFKMTWINNIPNTMRPAKKQVLNNASTLNDTLNSPLLPMELVRIETNSALPGYNQIHEGPEIP